MAAGILEVSLIIIIIIVPLKLVQQAGFQSPVKGLRGSSLSSHSWKYSMPEGVLVKKKKNTSCQIGLAFYLKLLLN